MPEISYIDLHSRAILHKDGLMSESENQTNAIKHVGIAFIHSYMQEIAMCFY